MAIATFLFFQGDTVLATDQAKGGSGMRWSPQTFRIADEAELLSTPRLANSPAFGPAECFRIATQQRDRPVASRSAIGQPKPL